MKYLIALIILCYLLSCKPNGASKGETPAVDSTASVVVDSTVKTDFLVVPGQSLGKARIGDSLAGFTKTIGPADDGNAAMGKSISTWYGRDKESKLQVYSVIDFGSADEQPMIKAVRASSTAFRTAEGFGPGSHLRELQANYDLYLVGKYLVSINGIQQNAHVYDDFSAGISFDISLDSLCTAVTVHPKGDSLANYYLPFEDNFMKLDKPARGLTTPPRRNN